MIIEDDTSGRKEHHPSPARSHSIRSYKSKYAGTPSKRHTHGTKPADIAAAELAEEVARNSLDTITTKSVEVDGGDTAAGNVENGGKAPRVSLGDLLGGNGKDWPMAELRERIMSTDGEWLPSAWHPPESPVWAHGELRV